MPTDEGKPSGLYDANSVRDRIRQWQSQGGGVISGEETGSEDEIPSRKQAKEDAQGRRSKPSTPSRKTAVKESTTQSRSSRSALKSGEATETRKRSGSAPAKRVVSDQHWRKKPISPDTDAHLKTRRNTSQLLNVPDESIQVQSVKKQASERKCKDTLNTPSVTLSGMRDCSSGDVEPELETHIPQSGSRKTSRRLKGRRRGEEPENATVDVSDLGSPGLNSKEDPEKNQNWVTPSNSGRKTSWTHTASSCRRHISLRRDGDGEDSKTRHTLSNTKGSQRSCKSNILNEIFTKNTPEPAISPRVPSIEQWLHETSDPFVDPEDSQVENIAPLRLPSQKRKVSPKENQVENPNRIWASVNTTEGTAKCVPGSRRSKRVSSSNLYKSNPFPPDFDSESGLESPTKSAKTETASKFVDLIKGSSEQMPSLSRRGANRSSSASLTHRQKSRRERDTSNNKDAISPTTSHITESSVEELDPIAPLQLPRLGNRRQFPSTGGHRLSTIASIETFDNKSQGAVPSFSNYAESHIDAVHKDKSVAEARDQFDPDSIRRKSSRLTKHADLISVLSQPKVNSRSIRSARSVRTNRTRLSNATKDTLMQELATDETKYMRELRTLVDGVIPVLLTCVLSKSDSAVAAGLFRSSSTANTDPNFTKPIIDMGIALERLKTLHKRMPINPNGFLTWAHGAQRVYSEYLKAWRMGFQDVVVNLAPATELGKNMGLEEGLPRNAEGDVTNGDGERVDVAFLLKRPLVRLKHLTRTLKGIETLHNSVEAKGLTSKYQRLVDEARQRSNEERARLEDEAAASIDATRARDLRTLAPVAGVVVDGTRRVRARDHFDLALQHSSGQRVDCRVEILLRDEASEKGEVGDVLICEVDGTGRWLLFPPVRFDGISARNGDLKGEIIVMIRGTSNGGTHWQELFSLISEDETAGFEWVQMLGLDPVPPNISRSQSFVSKHQAKKHKAPEHAVLVQSDSSSPGKSRTPSPREIDVPIGEPAQSISKTTTECSTERYSDTAGVPSPKNLVQQQTSVEEQLPRTPTRISTKHNGAVNDLQSLPSQNHDLESNQAKTPRTPRSFKEALGLSGSSNPMGLKRASAKRISKNGDAYHKSRRSPTSSPTGSIVENRDSEAFSQPSPFSTTKDTLGSDVSPTQPDLSGELGDNGRPSAQRSSSTPSMDLPFIPKARPMAPSVKQTIQLEEEPSWSSPPLSRLPGSPNKLSKKRPSSSNASPQSSPVNAVLDLNKSPNLEQVQAKQRRSSSPLKHEYEPSTASDTSSDSGTSTVEHNDVTSISDDSSDEELEEGDVPTALLPLGALRRFSKSAGKQSLYSNTNGSIKPSESASQAPYKTVPAQPTKASKTIASIFTWLDEGRWEQLHPDECSIIITPGLIEAFEMSAAHSDTKDPAIHTAVADMDRNSDLASTTTSQNDEVRGDRPLVALELTPLVPLRRGTALDISIRSPPTPQSQITSGNNIMFRSRSPEECEALYALINHSRIHNPTFIALQNARGPYSSGGMMGGPRSRHPSSHAGSHRSSWFGGWGRSPSYRASSGRTPSVVQSESSIGSMSSAFSALKRFSARNNGMFNIAKSTIGSRTGSRANSVYTSSDHSSGSGTNSPIPPGMMADARKDALIGLTDAKIRIYIRETASRWRDMGSARLTIKRAETDVLGPDGRPVSSGVGNGPATRQIPNEKRIIVHGKTKGEVLLDVQLGESCFERVARTGIAVSVWEDIVGPNGEVGVVNAVGGVAGGRAKVYMIQMKSEAETAYTFSLVGKLRY